MSYARFGIDSAVYVYASSGGGLDCCGCALSDSTIIKFSTSGQMVMHLTDHRIKGHSVPDYTFEEILEDYPDQTALIGIA